MAVDACLVADVIIGHWEGHCSRVATCFPKKRVDFFKKHVDFFKKRVDFFKKRVDFFKSSLVLNNPRHQLNQTTNFGA